MLKHTMHANIASDYVTTKAYTGIILIYKTESIMIIKYIFRSCYVHISYDSFYYFEKLHVSIIVFSHFEGLYWRTYFTDYHKTCPLSNENGNFHDTGSFFAKMIHFAFYDGYPLSPLVPSTYTCKQRHINHKHSHGKHRNTNASLIKIIICNHI